MLHLRRPGDEVHQETFEYDGSGRLARQYSFAQNGAKSNSSTFSYDARGNITKTETFAANGTLTNRSTYEFDDQPVPPGLPGFVRRFFSQPQQRRSGEE